MSWVNKQTSTTKDVRYVMEATGVYHESLAYYLCSIKKQASIVLPNKISQLIKYLDRKELNRTARNYQEHDFANKMTKQKKYQKGQK